MEKLEQYRSKILDLIEKNIENELLKEVVMAVSEIKLERSDEVVHRLFSDIYEVIFYDIAFKKSQLSLQTKKLLEALALPVNTRNLIKKEKLLLKANKL